MPKLATEGNLFATEDNTLICLDNSHTCRLTGIEKELCKKKSTRFGTHLKSWAQILTAEAQKTVSKYSKLDKIVKYVC